MSAAKRAQSFLFEPSAFANDPAVLDMNECEVGAYILLICGLWSMPEPGVIKDDDRVLAKVSRTGEKWLEYRAAVSRAFDLKSRPGHWVQKRMVQTHRHQSGHFARLRLAGSKGGKAKAEKDKASHAIASGSESGVAKRSGSGSGSGSGAGRSVDTGESLSLIPGLESQRDSHTPALPSGLERRHSIRRKALENGEHLPEGEITADQAFDEIFWPEYLRKKDKEDARKAWKSLKLRDDDEETITKIMAALRSDIKNEWRDRPMDKIPYPAHWLRKKGWLD